MAVLAAVYGGSRKSPLGIVSTLPRCYAISPLSNGLEVTTGKGKKTIDPCFSAPPSPLRWMHSPSTPCFPGAGQARNPSYEIT